MKLKDVIRADQVAQDVWEDCLARFMGINRTDSRCMDVIDRHGKITAGTLASEARLTTPPPAALRPGATGAPAAGTASAANAAARQIPR